MAMDLLVSSKGEAWLNRRAIRCALGRSGVVRQKREGDGGTPVGSFACRSVYWRPDRLARPLTLLPFAPLWPHHGWCDDSGDPAYNLPVTLPYPGSAETLWRNDAIYDLIVPLGYNDAPVIPGLGSAIFLHLARDGYMPTEGCVALAQPDLLDFLRFADTESRVIVTD